MEHLGSRLGVSNSLEGDGGVVAEVVGHHLLPAWVEPDQVGDVVDAVEEHHPTVLHTTVVSHLVKADQTELVVNDTQSDSIQCLNLAKK